LRSKLRMKCILETENGGYSWIVKRVWYTADGDSSFMDGYPFSGLVLKSTVSNKESIMKEANADVLEGTMYSVGEGC